MSSVLPAESFDQCSIKDGQGWKGPLELTAREKCSVRPARVPLPLFSCMISKVQCLQTGMKVFNVRA